MCDCNLGLIILVVILFKTQQVVSEHMVMCGKEGKVNGVLFAVRAGKRCMYLSLFTDRARWVPFAVGAGIVYCTKQAHKVHTKDLEKGTINDYYCQWC